MEVSGWTPGNFPPRSRVVLGRKVAPVLPFRLKKLLVPCLTALLLGLAGCETVATTDPAVVDISQLAKKPEARSRVAPIYPIEMRKQGISGQVVVEFIVDTQGNVANAFVVSSTNKAFESSALASILQWKFYPGIKGHRAVNTRLRQNLSYGFETN